MTGAMLDLGFILGLVLWAGAVGLRLARQFGPLPEHPTDALALGVPLGLGVLSVAVLGLGQVGELSRAGITGLLTLGALIASWPFCLGRGATQLTLSLSLWERVAAQPPGEERGSTIEPETPATPDIPPQPSPGRCAAALSQRERAGNLLDRFFDLALVAAVIGSFLTALAPVTDGDALCYHLQVPKVFLAAGSVGFEPDLHETVYPLITELLYAVALALRGPVACRLVQWVLGLVFAANVAALARPVLGWRARWAATIALLVPAVSNGMAAPLNDVALATFAAAALYAFVRWHEHPTWGAAALAGGLAGLALGVKYPALVWVGLLGLAMLVRGSRRHAGVFGAVALMVGMPWYWRAYHYTGNPVHPFFRGIFGSGLAEVLDPASLPIAVTLPNLLAAPALMTLWPEQFDSFAHQLGPLFLMLLPGLLMMKPPRRVAGLVVLGWAFLMICLTKRQSTRFVLAMVGPWAVGTAWVVAEVAKRRSLAARGVGAMLAGVVLFESMIALGHARHGLWVVLGRETAESYLARREPTYVVGRWIEANLPAAARVIGQDHRGFYLPRAYTMELAYRRRTGMATQGEGAEAIVERLRDEGFTHLLMCPPVPETAVEFDPTLGRALERWLSGREPLYREELADADGVVRRYAIYELGERPLSPSPLAGEGRGGETVTHSRGSPPPALTLPHKRGGNRKGASASLVASADAERGRP